MGQGTLTLGCKLSAVALSVSLAMMSTSSIAKEAKIKQLPLDDVKRFSIAVSQIKNYYVKDVKDKKLFENAIRGMLHGLDPHSAYLDEKDFKDLQASTRGEFSGLGIEVTMENGVIKVISPIDGTPAYDAGVKPGDYIIKLGETPIKGLSLRDAVSRMRGKTGTSIKLTIIRKGEDKPLIKDILRKKIVVQSVKHKMLDKQYGYIRVSHFQQHTARDTQKALKKLQKESNGRLKGLVIDLRNNPGGLLDSAIQVSDFFIHNDNQGAEEKIVFTKGRIQGSEFTANATPGDLMKKAPIVVLINQGSASASEIVAGALQDNKRAIIMGEKSFGKGSVQTVLPLDDNRGIKLTTALYYTPSGRSIQAKGVVPDITIASIDIPQPKKGVANSSLSEADLVGRLENGNGKIKQKASKKKEAKNLVYKDYQLHHALSLLKGLSITR